MKIVVFDLDETLGYFTQLSIFWDCLVRYIHQEKRTPTDPEQWTEWFHQVMELFPEFLRPNIIPILQYLKRKKQSNYCHSLHLYTNNTGSREWAAKIIQYFESVIQYKLFDRIIAAFKIKGTVIEVCRTTHRKTYTDLINCTQLPEDTEICFIDDYLYPEMIHDNIYYIHIKPYYYSLPFETMIDRFVQAGICGILAGHSFAEYMMKEMSGYRYMVRIKPENEYAIDYIVGKNIIIHLRRFFNSRNKTVKSATVYKQNKTRKQREPR